MRVRHWESIARSPMHVRRFTDTSLLTAFVNDNPGWKMFPRRLPRHWLRSLPAIGLCRSAARQAMVISRSRGFVAMPTFIERGGGCHELRDGPPANGRDAYCSNSHPGHLLALTFWSRANRKAGRRTCARQPSSPGKHCQSIRSGQNRSGVIS